VKLVDASNMEVTLSASAADKSYELAWVAHRGQLNDVNQEIVARLRQRGAHCWYAQFEDAVLLSLWDRSTRPYVRLLQGAAVAAGGVPSGVSLGTVRNRDGTLRVSLMVRGYKRKFVRALDEAGWTRDIKFVRV
jgi:hypothetical protein